MKNKIRVYMQFAILALIGYVAIRPLFDKSYVSDFEAYCPFGGIASLGSKLSQGTMSCNMSEVQVMLGIGLLVGVILVGKLFCSYVCPIGTVTEWLGRLGQKLKIRIEMPKLPDRLLRSLKYIILFAALYFTMTTSELFCKEFDPYFASANLFDNNDIVLYFAIPAFVLTILGSVFFRLFWCKYLCPLGAISNIFMNIVPVAAVIMIFAIANALGANLGFVYLVAGIVLVGMIAELGFMKSFFLPIPRVVRNNDTCSNCGLCDVKCPQGIKISEFKTINHIDCNLCTDCVYHCPLKNTLSINKSKNLRYLAPIAVVVLIAVSLGFSNGIEFTTISERWGDINPNNKLSTYEYVGLKNVKCYGSSMALKGTLENVEGIHGLDTYAKSHTVKIYYDPSVISENKVKSALFTPIKMETKLIGKNNIDSLAVLEVGVYGLFDLIDFNNLFYTLRGDKGVYGFETSFGEPVNAVVYYDPATTGPSEIINRINSKSVVAKKPTGNEVIELNFKTENDGFEKGKISVDNYKQRIFRIYDRLFNNYIQYNKSSLSVYVFPFPESGTAKLRRYLGSLASHLSADDGIVRLSTRYTKFPTGYIFFDPAKTSEVKIMESLTKKNLTVFTSKSETKDIENPYHIQPKGKVLSFDEVDIDEMN